MTTKLRLILLSTLLTAATTQAAVYVDARVSHLEISGTPNVGDIGRTLDEDLPATAFSLALGTSLTSRVSAEIRFTDLGDIDVLKVSPYWTIMPPVGDVLLPAERYYRYKQSTRLYTLAVPIEVWAKRHFSVILAPLVSVEQSRVTIDDLFINAQTVGLTVPYPNARYLDANRTKVRVGSDLTVAYRPVDHLKLSFTYTYSSLQNFDAHLIGAGVGWEF